MSTGQVASQSSLSEMEAALLQEVQTGTLERVHALITAGVEPRLVMHHGLGQNLVFFAVVRPDANTRILLLRLLIGQHNVDGAAIDRQLRQTPLFYAAREGDRACCDYLVERKCDPNYCDKNRQTPLFYAAKFGHACCVQFLIDKKAKPDQVDRNGQSPIFYAAKFGHAKLVKTLLQCGVNASRIDGVGRTALFNSLTPDATACCALLLGASCNPNHRDASSKTPLLVAAEMGRLSHARLLVEQGASVETADKSGWTALFWAAKGGSADVCRMLVTEAGADPCHEDHGGRTAQEIAKTVRKADMALFLEKAERNCAIAKTAVPAVAPTPQGVSLAEQLCKAVREGSLSQAKSLLDARADPATVAVARGQNLVFLAAARSEGARDMCALLVRRGVNPAVVDSQWQQTSLFFAVRPGSYAGGLECAKYLLSAQCDPDHADMHMQTPLFYAVQRQDALCTQALIAAGASVNQADVLAPGQTPAFYAAKSGSEASLRVLIEARADMKVQDGLGRTSLFAAVTSPIVQLLVDHGCPVTS